MRVLEIWRYPVKSIGGERLTDTEVDAHGIPFDRGWGVVDDLTGNVLTARREPRLLRAAAALDGSEPVITTAEGHELRTSDDVSEWLERPVTLTAAAGRGGGTYEVPLDADNDQEWITWQGPGDAWHDSADTRLSIVSTDSLGNWDFRRFRSNVLVDGHGEDDLVGKAAKLGTCEVRIRTRVGRCVMVTRAQPGLDGDLDVLHTINCEREGCLAIGATIVTAGRVGIGDELAAR